MRGRQSPSLRSPLKSVGDAMFRTVALTKRSSINRSAPSLRALNPDNGLGTKAFKLVRELPVKGEPKW